MTHLTMTTMSKMRKSMNTKIYICKVKVENEGGKMRVLMEVNRMKCYLMMK